MRVALIEISGSHDECLFSQASFITSGPENKLSIFCDPQVYQRISYLHPLYDCRSVKVRKGLFRFPDLLRLRKQLINENFNCIIFNTAQSSLIKNLLHLSFPDNTLLFGTLHNLRKLGASSQKKINRKLSGYFLLSETLERAARKINPSGNYCWYYPMFFPEFNAHELPKKEEEIWIAIPGQVEYKRRDYLSLISVLKNLNPEKKLRFLLLGKAFHPEGDGEQLKMQIDQNKQGGHFKFWHDFIDPPTFHAYLKSCDYVLPLIHVQHESYQLYKTQITGAFNLAFAYRKPLLLEQSLPYQEEFRDARISYELSNFGDFLNSLEPMQNKVFYQSEKWTFAYQQEKYMSFLNRGCP